MRLEKNICSFSFLTQKITTVLSLFLAVCLWLDTQYCLLSERIECNPDMEVYNKSNKSNLRTMTGWHSSTICSLEYDGDSLTDTV